MSSKPKAFESPSVAGKNTSPLSPRLGVAVVAGLLAFLAVEVVSAGWLSGAMWGLHSLRFVGDGMALVVLLAVAGVCAISAHRQVARLVAWLGKHPVYTASAAVCAGGLLFWNLRATTSFLGDGNILLLSVARMLFRPSDVVDFHIHALFYRTFLAEQRAEPIVAYNMLSTFAGMVFLAGAVLFSQIVGKTFPQKVFCFLLVSTGGYMAVFCGYVESYSLLYAVFPWYAALSLRALQGKEVVPAIIACVIAVAFHQTAALLGPSMLLVLWVGVMRTKNKFAKAVLYCLTSVALGGAVLGYLVSAGFSIEEYRAMLKETGMSSGKLFLPLFSGSYAVFSPRHILDSLNLHLLASPLAFLALPFLLGPKILLKDRGAQFLALAFVFEFAFYSLINPTIDLFRDWDLFAAPALLYTFYVAYVVVTRGILTGRPRTQILVVTVAALHCLAWAFVNHGDESSAQRFLALTESRASVTLPHVTAHNYEQLGAFYSERKDLRTAAQLLQKGVSALPHVRRYGSLAMAYVSLGDYAKAADAFGGGADLDSNQVEMRLNQGISLYRAQSFDKAAQAMATVVRRGYVKDFVFAVLGDCYARTNRIDEARVAYEEALRLNPKNREAIEALDRLKQGTAPSPRSTR